MSAVEVPCPASVSVWLRIVTPFKCRVDGEHIRGKATTPQGMFVPQQLRNFQLSVQQMSHLTKGKCSNFTESERVYALAGSGVARGNASQSDGNACWMRYKYSPPPPDLSGIVSSHPISGWVWLHWSPHCSSSCQPGGLDRPRSQVT